MLTVTYVALCLIGCGYVLASVLMGHGTDVAAGGGHVADPSVDYGAGGHGEAHASDVAHAEFHFPLFSPLALATLFASLGAWGLIAKHGFDVTDGQSLAIALPAALGTAYAVTYVTFKLIQSSQGTTAIRNADIVGARAEVITPIPAGGMGEVAALVGGQRFTAPAREAKGGAVARGTFVKVMQSVGSTLVVAADPGPQGGS
jgi:membrane protein implicated in regulation of membrane protease activity